MRPAASAPVFHAICGASLRDNPGRLLLAVSGIALGVALGVAVHLINYSALDEFRLAAHRLTGNADLVVRAPRSGFDERLYPHLARLPQVQAASPVVEAEAQLAGRPETLKIIGLDPFRAAQMQPEAVGVGTVAMRELLEGDAVLLSPAAASWLKLGVGDVLRIRAGTADVGFRIAGLLPPGAYRQRLAVMDIAAAQWRLARLGRLNRIDLRLRPGVAVEAFRKSLQAQLPPGALAATPDEEVTASTGMSRAYRLNLDALALVALLTGAFLVFSTQALATLRRRTQFALLRAMGLTRSALTGWLLAEGAMVGALGASLGTALGCAIATYALDQFAGDLGAGYFHGIAPVLQFDPVTLTAFWSAGVLCALLGAMAPAVEAARRAPALALKAGDVEEGLERIESAWAGPLLIVAGLALTQGPPLAGLPVFGYAAVAAILLGAILAMPRLAAFCLGRLPLPRRVPAALAAAQLQATPRQAAISIAAVVASFSLTVAMLIMIGSFRASLDAWLAQMLPADLHVRAAHAGETGFLTPQEQARVAATPGIARAQFLRSQQLLLRADRPPVTLLARTIDPATADRTLPLTGPALILPDDALPPVWISEVAADLFGWRAGERISLPLAGRAVPFIVAGVWRDYARQNGAVVMDRDLYIRLTGDALASDAALWLAAGVTPPQAQQALRQRLPDTLEIVPTRAIRAASLSIFDRTFAVTYALELVALLIGLFGVSVGFSARVLARRREFGVLRHLGMTRGEIGAMLGCEGALVAGLGSGCGLALGWLIGLILIRVINRQAFHWSIDLHPPWLALAAAATALVAAASLTAVWSGRRAMDTDAVRAVREDW